MLRSSDCWLAFDCGPPAPPYLPAHAHADVLSFQLWWDDCPVVIDPGTFTYEPGAERDWFRGTRAHSTIAVDRRDQFELWGAFRSGRLPRGELVGASTQALVGCVQLGGVLHERRIEIEADEIRVIDRLDGQGVHEVESSLPLGPASPISITALGPLALETEQRSFSEVFHVREAGRALVQRGRVSLPFELGWVLRRTA